MTEKTTPETAFDLFISYYSNTGKDFARFLKSGLKDFNENAFLDEEDIPKSVETDSDEFRKYVDNAIKESSDFVLIMTVGFNKRNEIARELKLAFESDKKKFFMKQTDLATTDLIIEIDNKQVDLSKYEFIPFSNESDLLRKMVSALLGKIGLSKETVFVQQAKRIISSEGLEFKKEGFPLVETLIGPANEGVEWLQVNPQNKFLVSCFPYYNEIEARRNFFETKPDKDVFLKVNTKGFFHSIIRLLSDNPSSFTFDTIFMEIVQPLLFSIRLMKYRGVEGEHSMLLLLKNVGGKEVSFDTFWGSIRKYSFTNSLNEIEFSYSFYPQREWKKITPIFFKIYKDLCVEAGCLTILDTTVEQRVRNCISSMGELRTSYNGENITLPLVERTLFDFK
jgi:hypothetical protein